MTTWHHDNRVFSKPSMPENTWQLLSWIIFEPILLDRYSDTLSKKQAIAIFLRTYPLILLISLVFFLFGCFVIVATDTPTLFHAQYKTEFVDNFRVLSGIEHKLFFIIQESIVNLTIMLAVGLAVGLVFRLYYVLTFVFAVSVAFGISFGLGSGLTYGVAGGLAVGFGMGISFGLPYGIPSGLTLGVVGGLAGGLVLGLTYGLAFGLAGMFGWYFAYFRLFFYLFHFIYSLLGISFYSSPYHKDAVILLPLWGVKKNFAVWP